MPHNLFNSLQTFTPAKGLTGQLYSLPQLEKEYQFWGDVPRILIENPASLKTLQSKFRKLKIADALPFLGTYNLDHSRVSESFFHLLPAFAMLEMDSELSLMEKYCNPRY